MLRPLLAAALAALAQLAPGAALAEAPAKVVAASVEAKGASTFIAVEIDGDGASAKSFFLDNPSRFVIDVPAKLAIANRPAPGGVVQAVRYAERNDGATRLVFDLGAPATLARKTGQGARLFFELAGPAPAAKAEEPVRSAPAPKARRRVIVVDAGHGGKDPGASGATLREKDVVLASALALKRELEARGGYEVVLTRDDDRFLSLQERVRFARKRRADLFISLHADSNGNADAAGASVYTLSERGGARAKNLIDSQDWRILPASRYSPQVETILVDLAQRETKNRSAEFAETLIAELNPNAPLLRRTHRNAGYFVLLAPDVPAVLLELGFLSNAADEKRLGDPAARAKAMAGVADAIGVYFARPRAYAENG